MALIDTVKHALNNGKRIIVAVDTPAHIEKLLILRKNPNTDKFEKLSVSKTWVIDSINGDREFFTLNTTSSTLTKVSIVNGQSEKYLRTDSNTTPRDNLDELPNVLFMDTILDLHI